MRLTPLMRKLIQAMPDGSFMRKHLRPDGTECYRLLTSDSKPIANYPTGTISKLNGGGYLNYSNGRVVLADNVYISPTGRIYKKKTTRICKQ